MKNAIRLLVCIVVSGLLTPTSFVGAAKDDNNVDYVLRWASSGGGWRAMVANLGYANAFAQTGPDFIYI